MKSLKSVLEDRRDFQRWNSAQTTVSLVLYPGLSSEQKLELAIEFCNTGKISESSRGKVYRIVREQGYAL